MVYNVKSDYPNSAGIRTKTVIINATDIVSLSDNPYVLIPAPGARKAIDVIRVVYGATGISSDYEPNFSARMYWGNNTGDSMDNSSITGYINTLSRVEPSEQSIDFMDCINLPFVMDLFTGTPNVPGGVVAFSIGAGGTSYTVNDVLTTGDASWLVTDVGEGGEVEEINLINPGTRVTIANGQLLAGGTGTSASINVTEIDPTVNTYKMVIKLAYMIVDFN